VLPVLLHPSKEVTRVPSAVGVKNPATAPWSLHGSWSILFPDKIMKTKEQDFRQILRRIFRRRMRRHDPMLVLNMDLFNFTDGWNRAFSRDQYARFSV